jgi:hypothetical protein
MSAIEVYCKGTLVGIYSDPTVYRWEDCSSLRRVVNVPIRSDIRPDISTLQLGIILYVMVDEYEHYILEVQDLVGLRYLQGFSPTDNAARMLPR